MELSDERVLEILWWVKWLCASNNIHVLRTCIGTCMYVGTGQVDSMWRWIVWQGERLAWLATGRSAVGVIRWVWLIGVAGKVE